MRTVTIPLDEYEYLKTEIEKLKVSLETATKEFFVIENYGHPQYNICNIKTKDILIADLAETAKKERDDAMSILRQKLKLKNDFDELTVKWNYLSKKIDNLPTIIKVIFL